MGSVLDLLASLIHFLGDLVVDPVTTAAVDTGAIRTNTLAPHAIEATHKNQVFVRTNQREKRFRGSTEFAGYPNRARYVSRPKGSDFE